VLLQRLDLGTYELLCGTVFEEREAKKFTLLSILCMSLVTGVEHLLCEADKLKI
jgi:hypothetical protein